jgi:hypothetical protein
MSIVPGSAELKKLLIENNFEIYRTVGSRVMLAERVRDNLLMDANVSAAVLDTYVAGATVRAQSGDFDGDSEAQLFARALGLARPMLDRGYREASRTIVPIADPGNSSRILDTWYEIAFEREVAAFDELAVELRYLLTLEKVVTRTRTAAT